MALNDLNEVDKNSVIAGLVILFGMIGILLIWCHCQFRATARKLWALVSGRRREHQDNTELGTADATGAFYVTRRPDGNA
ncbi:hypothetical protein VE03_07701 [Pseudogymnoascus sp. 23342-1-I1]|nr:hypothetical protein VE03_07701 [Pseudogymnoascus sp. 23342-1-I1]